MAGGLREESSRRRSSRDCRDCRADARRDRSSRSRSRSRRPERELPSPETSDSEVEASPFVGRYTGGTGCLATESLRQVDTVCGTHTYTMVGYTLARAMGPGTRLCSDLFEVGGQLFRLELYPAGLNAAGHKYLGLFLTSPGSLRPGHLLYQLSVIDKSTLKPVHVTEARTAATPPPTAPATLQAPAPGVVAGFPRFVKSNFLHRNSRRFLHDDTLTVRATVKMLTGWSSFPVPQPQQPQVFALHPTSPAAMAAAAAATALPAPGGMVLMPPSSALQPQQLVYSGLQPPLVAATHGGAGYGLVAAPPGVSGSQQYYLAPAAAAPQPGMAWASGCPCPCTCRSPGPCHCHGSGAASPHAVYASSAAMLPLYPQSPQQQAQQAATGGWQLGASPYGQSSGGGGGGVAYGYGTAAMAPGQGLAPGQAGTAPAVLQAGPGGYMTMVGPQAMAWQAQPVAVGTAPF
ncbi:hypothetical protein HXX76_001014 [Chlamydomonas incerta]|uniref:MATH domain-containing protein n=1 Tax=Chlamydomonas incerta TaxID=51695 RepID=A0A835WBD0_CHLIN|nr:hypothetical protein HXX76_001014 [Chlamydomonas incerta]|eukprot:KAG2444257.1 hypothetical protein HXX76_001014 [Chlamydomonas incerta]